MEFAGNKSPITPEAVFIIGTYDENGVLNAMNATWAMQSDMNEIYQSSTAADLRLRIETDD